MELPPEMFEVRAQFEEATRATDPAKKCLALQKALDTMELYEEDHPSMEASERRVLTNLRQSHTRVLIDQLVTMPNMEIEVWFEYIMLFILRLKNDVELALQEHPELRKNYDEFKEIYKKELTEAAKNPQSKQP
jgi:hypothetical protein